MYLCAYIKLSESNCNFLNICYYHVYIIITITDVGHVLGLAVDPGAGKLYFSRYDDSKVEVANLNGSGRETFISHAAPSKAAGIALDLTEG